MFAAVRYLAAVTGSSKRLWLPLGLAVFALLTSTMIDNEPVHVIFGRLTVVVFAFSWWTTVAVVGVEHGTYRAMSETAVGGSRRYLRAELALVAVICAGAIILCACVPILTFLHATTPADFGAALLAFTACALLGTAGGLPFTRIVMPRRTPARWASVVAVVALTCIPHMPPIVTLLDILTERPATFWTYIWCSVYLVVSLMVARESARFTHHRATRTFIGAV